MRQLLWAVLLLSLPSLACPDGYMIRRESEVPVFWSDADGEPDCSADDNIAFWARTDASSPGQFTFCKLATDVLDTGTGRIINELIPYPEPLSAIPPIGGCSGYQHLGIDTTQTGNKYKLYACDKGVGGNFKAEPWTAKFDRVTDSLGNARTCDNGQDCTMAFGAGTTGVQIVVGGTAPNFTATPNLVGSTMGILTYDCVDDGTVATASYHLRAFAAGTAAAAACNVTDSVANFNRKIIPRAALLRNLSCAVSSAPGGSDTAVFTAKVNTAATGVTCTITGAATTCADTTNTAAVTAGGQVSILYDPSADETYSVTCSVEVAYP
jgi:hypothetical protein